MTDEAKTSDVDMTHDSDDVDNKQSEILASSQNIRLPPFWNNNPRVWFIASEAQFNIHKIVKDETKYLQIILSLSSEQCASIVDILDNPPSSNKYETLKAALIERNSMSEEKQLEALLEKSDIGDRRPSDVLRHIRNLAGPNLSSQLIKSLWMRKMPEFIRLALISQGDSQTIEEQAKTADKLNEAVSSNTTIAAITRSGRSTQRQKLFRPALSHEESEQPSTQQGTLEERMSKVETALARLTHRSRSRSRGRRFLSQQGSRKNSINNRFSSQRRYNSRSNNRSNRFSTCWYHRNFGVEATKCEKPCNFGPNNSSIENKTSPPNQ